ncbi:ATP binding cassette-like protein [Gordonia phage BiggityBass]|nr:ATP binding cassette-like protein [Gordonia phage BiggityBass]
MTLVKVDNVSPPFNSYRANRVKSLFNATDEQATRFTIEADLPFDDPNWSIGVIAGPSGSGKTSLGSHAWGGEHIYAPEWPTDRPIVDVIAPDGDFDAVTGALAQAGLGDVPAWLRTYGVLSMGQRFRADLARVIAEAPDRVVLDEFTSVVDRQIAKVGAGAFAKAWRRTGGQAVLLTCHYDILDWVEPDWVYDTATRHFQTKECLQHRRPRIDVEVRMGGWDLWPLFKPHHYLDSGPMVGAKCYVAFVDGEPVAHLGMGTKNVTAKDPKTGRRVNAVEARGCRMVTLPEWQGAGIGMKFLNHVCELQLRGEGVLPGRKMTTQFHTSHPQLAAGLRRSPYWRQVSGSLYASSSRKAFRDSVTRTAARRTASGKGGRSLMPMDPGRNSGGFGGHLRAVQGFRYYGERAAQK